MLVSYFKREARDMVYMAGEKNVSLNSEEEVLERTGSGQAAA